LLRRVREALGHGGLKKVGAAYGGGHVFAAVGLTFLLNLFATAMASIAIPSLIAPFLGLLIGFGRAVIWGLLLSPADPQLRWAMIPHGVTLLLEGQAYAHAVAWLRPQTVGQRTHLGGYLAGLKSTALIYLLVILMVAVAAVYEALEVIYLAPLLTAR
jgi:hypothetical protein